MLRSINGLKWLSRLQITQNRSTGKLTYYIQKCDVYTRVIKADYDARLNDGTTTISTHNTCSNTHRRYFTTIGGTAYRKGDLAAIAEELLTTSDYYDYRCDGYKSGLMQNLKNNYPLLSHAQRMDVVDAALALATAK